MSLFYPEFRSFLGAERLPAAIVDVDAFDRNVAALAGHLKGSGKTLRLATKSLRVPALIERVLRFGPPYQGLMCFSAEEALWLSEQGFDDLLVAYPTLQACDLQALRKAHESGRDVKLIVDSPEGVAALANQMAGVSRPFRVVIDVDASLRLFGGRVHLGVRRSPVRGAGDVEALLDVLARHCEVLRPIGAMAYEAQVAGLGDRNPFKRLVNPVARLIRKVSMPHVARLRTEIAAVFKGRGMCIELFNGGGSGSVNWTAREEPLTEVSAGSAFLCPHLFDYYTNVRFEPAAFFALQAVRASDKGLVTCLGGGYVASGEPGIDRLPRPVFPEGAKLISMEGAGEVQTPVRLDTGKDVRLGDPVVFRHAKAGELAERFNDYLLVSSGRIVDRVKTYRGHGLSFL